MPAKTAACKLCPQRHSGFSQQGQCRPVHACQTLGGPAILAKGGYSGSILYTMQCSNGVLAPWGLFPLAKLLVCTNEQTLLNTTCPFKGFVSY